MESFTLGIDGMTCGGCVASVEGAIGRVPGVKAVKADLQKKEAQVEGEGVDLERVKAAVYDAGFEIR